GEVEEKGILDKIKQREKGFLFYKDKIYIGSLEENVNKFGIKLVDDESVVSGKVEQKEDQIKGQTAYPGKVRGKVKVVLRYGDIGEVEKGDILVSPMTMPKYLPAMKKAGAIVTDEGGITCHAAIVSREMKKPAIVGTKIASQILKDGDEVEVDAEKGIVKIIKKAN
ncbi:MAG: PEP-utilizing enzyme, partial [Actinomycetota bacterium]